MMGGLRVVPFNEELRTTVAKSFDCGNSYINRFLRSTEALNKGIGKTYVCLAERDGGIVGFYNLSTGYVEQMVAPQRIEKIGGSIHINHFALDNRYHGCKVVDGPETFYLSDWLLSDCLALIEHIREIFVGFSFVTLWSTKEGHPLYLRNGFEDLEDDMAFTSAEGESQCYPMYLALDEE